MKQNVFQINYFQKSETQQKNFLPSAVFRNFEVHAKGFRRRKGTERTTQQ